MSKIHIPKGAILKIRSDIVEGGDKESKITDKMLRYKGCTAKVLYILSDNTFLTDSTQLFWWSKVSVEWIEKIDNAHYRHISCLKGRTITTEFVVPNVERDEDAEAALINEIVKLYSALEIDFKDIKVTKLKAAKANDETFEMWTVVSTYSGSLSETIQITIIMTENVFYGGKKKPFYVNRQTMPKVMAKAVIDQ